MRPDPTLEPKDVETLAYLHSNKFMTPRLFHRKFHPEQTYATACSRLRALEAKGLVLRVRKFQNDDNYFYLSRKALKQLSGLARILTTPEIRSPHINPFEREHDKRVVAMRVQIEAEGGLEGLAWLSDYEMRCGLKFEWKRALEAGAGWDLAGKVKPRRVHHRTPDGYFEGTLEGRACSFVLEYEHSAYNRDKMAGMVLNLRRDFPEAFRLVVSRDKAHAVRMMNGLATFLQGDPREAALWGFNFFEKVDRLPFRRVPWARLGGGYLPFVKDPILKSLAAPEAVPMAEGMTA
ncbi:MAG TPA: hypothetical protein VHE12_03415 [bacterium]|nr:hypothetical protein [bacterium]